MRSVNSLKICDCVRERSKKVCAYYSCKGVYLGEMLEISWYYISLFLSCVNARILSLTESEEQ